MHCFYTSAFLTSCFVLPVTDCRIKQRTCIKSCVKFSKSATKTLEVLREAFGEHSSSQTLVSELHWRCQSSVGWRWGICLRRSTTSKPTENVERIWEPIHEDNSLTIWARRHSCDQLWSLPGDLNIRRMTTKFVSPTPDMWSTAAIHKCIFSCKERLMRFQYFILKIAKTKTKLHGLSPRANYTDRASAACRRSDCQLLRIEGATWSAWRIPTAVFSVF
jgi:hypothetical protein